MDFPRPCVNGIALRVVVVASIIFILKGVENEGNDPLLVEPPN